MNGFADKGLDESNFGSGDGSTASKVVKAFDAFPKTKPTYTEKTQSGGVWTVVLICVSLLLTFSEVQRWWVGDTTHTFSVEQGVGHDLQINLDVVVKMKCADLHINVQDASGDRILAGSALNKDPTVFSQWINGRRILKGADRNKQGGPDLSKYPGFGEYREEDVHNYLGAARTKKNFGKTPRLPRGYEGDSCRIYGTMHGNKVQGDFHITARGHGYMEFGEHLPHTSFNFSHHINELSFGPFYPSLTNPLDNTFATTESNFYKYQYYLSVVPTIYTTDAKALRQIITHHESPSSGEDGLSQHPYRYSKNTVFTNQYAVTEQSLAVPENQVPGLFVKFDIEPILLTIAEEWASIPALLIRLVNVVAGVLVAGGWCYQLTEWSKENRRPRMRRDTTGLLASVNGQLDEKHGV